MDTKKSILESHMDEIFSAPDVSSCLKIFSDVVSESRIREYDKRKMLMTAGRMESLPALQQYATNSMFKFMGMGV